MASANVIYWPAIVYWATFRSVQHQRTSRRYAALTAMCAAMTRETTLKILGSHMGVRRQEAYVHRQYYIGCCVWLIFALLCCAGVLP